VKLPVALSQRLCAYCQFGSDRFKGKSFRTTTKPLKTATKGVETTGKGIGNRSSPSVHEGNSEVCHVARQRDPAKRRPTRPSLTVFALAFSSANHKPLYHAAISPIPLRLCGS